MRYTATVLVHLRNLILVCLALLPAADAAETTQEKMQREVTEQKTERMKGTLQRADVAIQFYGRVLDQLSNPVEEADVVLLVTQFSPDEKTFFSRIREVQVRTDSQGRFAVSEKTGRSLSLKKIQKEGYEFSLSQNPHGEYRYSGLSQQYLFVPDKQKPVVFHMRKMGPTTFLFQDDDLTFQFLPRQSGRTIGYDFIQRLKIAEGGRPTIPPVPLVCDLAVKATFNAGDATWTVTLAPGSPEGGIIVSEQLLYEAPATGYQPEYTFTPENLKPIKARYVYLRSRNPAIYTRIEMDRNNANQKFFHLNGSSVTNPYGERNLERAVDLPFEVVKNLTDEAQDAFLKGKRPPKPDLAAMVREAKDKDAVNNGKPGSAATQQAQGATSQGIQGAGVGLDGLGP
jgi:hypothetical protein